MPGLDPAIQAQPLEIRSAESAADFRAFFEFPWKLYKDMPYWVPPLVSMRRELLDKKKNPAWSYMEGQYYGAWRGDELVGTITAFVNHRHNEYWREHIGWFGTFEVYDDPEVAHALLRTAEEWVRERGYDAIRGPQSFTTHEETGLLVKNFEPAVIMMPYNPEYYEGLIQSAGYERVMDLHSIYYGREMEPEVGMGRRLKSLADRAAKRANITIRTMDSSRKPQEFELFKELYNRAWDKNWGFVPMTNEELDALIESLGMLLDPNLAFFAEVNGEPAGFAIAVPDFNQALHKVYPRPGVPEPISLIQLLWQWKVRRVIKGIRVPFMGVVEEHRFKGVELNLLSATFENLPAQYEYADCGWILETNDLVKISHKLGGESYKIHRYYQKTFAEGDA